MKELKLSTSRDFLRNIIKIGDEVVFAHADMNTLFRGVIVDISNRMCRIKYEPTDKSIITDGPFHVRWYLTDVVKI